MMPTESMRCSALLLATCALLLTGCGQTGPLYLPPAHGTAKAAAPASTHDAPTTTPAGTGTVDTVNPSATHP